MSGYIDDRLKTRQIDKYEKTNISSTVERSDSLSTQYIGLVHLNASLLTMDAEAIRLQTIFTIFDLASLLKLNFVCFLGGIFRFFYCPLLNLKMHRCIYLFTFFLFFFSSV